MKIHSDFLDFIEALNHNPELRFLPSKMYVD
jgi:hypothetical protein